MYIASARLERGFSGCRIWRLGNGDGGQLQACAYINRSK